MSNAYSRKMFVNLAVKDLGRSMGFFRGLGFQFDPKFTNDKGACMIISDQAYVMLLSEPFFKTFTKKKICETASHTEGLFALSCISLHASVKAFDEKQRPKRAGSRGESRTRIFPGIKAQVRFSNRRNNWS